MDNKLKRLAVKGMAWNFFENVFSYIIKFSIGVLLARILSPEDFGLVGIAFIIFSIAEIIINSGFSEAFIRLDNAKKEDANTVFITNVIISIIIYTILWFISPLIAKYFRQPELIWIIRIMALVIIINSINIIQIALIRKNLEFKKRTILFLSASVISGIVGIILALNKFGVWSLVLREIINKIFICTLLYMTSKWKMTFKYSISSFKKMFIYGLWLLMSHLLLRIFSNLYRIVIGRYFPVHQLGLYDRGHQIAGNIYETIWWSIGSVAFPVYSKLLDEKNKLEEALTKIVKYSSFIIMPVLAILFIVADPLVILLLTEKWKGSIIYVKLFCLIGLINPLYDYLTQFIEAIGKSKDSFMYNVAFVIFRLINVSINLKRGIEAVLIGEIVIQIIMLIGVSLISKSYMGFNYLTTIIKMRWIIFSTIISVISGFICLRVCPSIKVIEIILPSIFMFITYLIVMTLKERQTIQRTISLLLYKNV